MRPTIRRTQKLLPNRATSKLNDKRGRVTINVIQEHRRLLEDGSYRLLEDGSFRLLE